ncbi:hypothetical protein J6590_047737 [Homalodisca vitripennis]|nr:hypothetical protein J6590_047737 [Homalodisca vitripennis]
MEEEPTPSPLTNTPVTVPPLMSEMPKSFDLSQSSYAVTAVVPFFNCYVTVVPIHFSHSTRIRKSESLVRPVGDYLIETQL